MHLFSPGLDFHLLATRVGWTLLHSIWQGVAVTALLAAGLRAPFRQTAAARHALCLLAMAGLTTCAGATLLRTGRGSATGAMAAATVPPAHTAAVETKITGAATGQPAGLTSSANPPAPERGEPGQAGAPGPGWRTRLEAMLPGIVLAWAAGVLLLSLRHAGGWWWVQSLRGGGLPASTEARKVFADVCGRYGIHTRAVRLMESAAAGVPMLTGLLRPVVLLPAQAVTGLSPAQLEAVLAHELAHLVRRDAWTNLALVAVETVFFYHPAVWWIGRRAREEREMAADDRALGVCHDRREYAGALARLAEFAQAAPTFTLAGTGAGRGSLLHRIRRIVQPSVLPTPGAPGAWGLTLPPALLAVVAGLVWIGQGRAAEPTVVNVAPGQSIQAAIDAAPAGAVVRLGAGEWREGIVITKPLTLEGAGWEKTRLTVEEPSVAEAAKASADLEPRRAAAKNDEEKQTASAEWVRRIVHPALWVHDAEGVRLRELRVQGLSKADPKGGLGPAALVCLQRGKAAVENCAFVGPYANGIILEEGAEADIKGSLVAALWAEGIVVEGRARPGGESPVCRLHLEDSEVRSVYHYGIVLGPGCDTTRIERCRISGTAWHGIRYDDASPTIVHNAIFAHARSGIYASGKTHGTVRDNLFWKNEMDGMSSWDGGEDLVEGNTIVGNLRSGLEILGKSKPTISHNLFVANPVGVGCYNLPPGAAADPASGPVLTDDLFWNNGQVLTGRPTPTAGLPAADPQFVDPTHGDFTLAAHSLARKEGVGIAEPLPPAGPWPLLAEEKSILPTGDSHSFNLWRAPGEAPPTPAPSINPGNQPAAGSAANATSTEAPAVTAQEVEDVRVARLLATNRQAARVRAAQDRTVYTPEQLQEIETLYQVANNKGLHDTDARASLKQLLDKYDRANRTGCATLYYGQGSRGAERVEYLTRAVEKYSDCYYFNGCQVGGYGRAVLAMTLWEEGQKDKARAVLAELRTTYKDATDHHGRPLSEAATAIERDFATVHP